MEVVPFIPTLEYMKDSFFLLAGGQTQVSALGEVTAGIRSILLEMLDAIRA